MSAPVSPDTIGTAERSIALGKVTLEAIMVAHWRDLGKTAATITPSKVGSLNPDIADAEAVASDIKALARVLMPVIEDLCDYGSTYLGADREECRDQFNIISDALSDLQGIMSHAVSP